MKTDARTRYTKKVLRDALLRLMKTRTIKETTVKEVCALAELNRTTFYKHYRDCYDLLAQIENEMIDDYVASLRNLHSFDATDLIEAIFSVIEKNDDLCQLLLFNRDDDALIKKMIAVTHDVSIENWRAQLKRISPDELELLFTCLANGIMRVVVDGYKRYDKNQLIQFVNTVVLSCVAAYR